LTLTDRTLDELGYYLLAGAGGEGPASLMDEARRGEELGFGTAFISERWNVKEASSLVGAACAVTTRMQIATAATNHNTRHPLITGSWATTMHRLSGGRFTLGIGRGIAAIYGAFGMPAVTTAQMEDWAQVMRRLWHGEVIFNHEGPMGQYPVLFLDPDFNEDIRLALVAFGPKTLALGGGCSTTSYSTLTSPQRRCSAAPKPSNPPRRRRAATRTACGCGRASPRSVTIFPNSCG
jgi:probable F420-dependent oxidoreductase